MMIINYGNVFLAAGLMTWQNTLSPIKYVVPVETSKFFNITPGVIPWKCICTILINKFKTKIYEIFTGFPFPHVPPKSSTLKKCIQKDFVQTGTKLHNCLQFPCPCSHLQVVITSLAVAASDIPSGCIIGGRGRPRNSDISCDKR